MSRNDGLKVLAARLDPKIIEKFDEFCERHSTESKQWLLEFALYHATHLKEAEFKRLYEPFYQKRSLRKREIKLELAKKKK